MPHQALLDHLNQVLSPERFRDYCPNGLQVEGRRPIHKLVTGVSASLALIEAAIEAQADAVLVHHGLFWKGDDGRVTGWLRERLALLMRHDLHLFAYHLPLDAHPVLGNNVQLARVLSLGPVRPEQSFGDQNLGLWSEPEAAPGALSEGMPPSILLSDLSARVEQALGRAPLVIKSPRSGDNPRLSRIAWCTGGAQSYFQDAIAAGADAFITGEISEPQTHWARECGVVYLACGHHATERYGVQAVGAHAAQTLGLVHEFIDIDNPV